MVVPKKIGVDKHRESRTLGEAVGAELTPLRLARGWSQQKLADQLGYTERYVGQLERGAKSPTLRTIADLAEAFSTKPSIILRGRRASVAEQRKTLIAIGAFGTQSAHRASTDRGDRGFS